MSEWELNVSEERSLRIPNKIRNEPPPSLSCGADTNTHVCAAYDRMCIIGLPLSKVVNFAALVLNEACKLRQDSVSPARYARERDIKDH